ALNSQRLRTSAEPAPPRQIVYGRAKVGGRLVFHHVSNEVGINRALHMVIAVASHEVEDIEDVYFGDERLVLASNGGVLNWNYNGGRAETWVLWVPEGVYVNQTFSIDIQGETFSVMVTGTPFDVVIALVEEIRS